MMSGIPATTVFGAGDLQALVLQLNLWTSQIELTPQELRGAQLVMSGQMQRLVESAEIDIMKVIVSFRNELDVSRNSLTTISSKQAASRGVSAPQPAPQTVPKCSDTTKSGPVRCRCSAFMNERHNPAGRNTEPARRSTDGTVTRNQNTTQVQRGPETFDRPQEAGSEFETRRFVAWCDRALVYLAAERPDVRKLLSWAVSQNPTIGVAEELRGSHQSRSAWRHLPH